MGKGPSVSNIIQLFGFRPKAVASKTFSVDPDTLAAAKQVERGGHCSCLGSRTKKGAPSVPNLHVEEQDRSAAGWQALLTAITAEPMATVLRPSAAIASDQWSGVVTLPSEIQSLTSLRELHLYGSHLRRLPPETGRLVNLENLDVYTSYSLHWLPYEVTRCIRLKSSRMSTRALYGNVKTRLPFPRLSSPIEALLPQTCSVCDGPFHSGSIHPFWTTQRVGTDFVPLLIHGCSADCIDQVPDAPDGYHARPHREGPWPS